MHELEEIFRQRKSLVNGLTVPEIVCLVNNFSTKRANKIRESNIKRHWSKIRRAKGFLAEKETMAIVKKQANKGFILIDEKLGKRKITKNTNVFYNCPNVSDAKEYRSNLDKLANGIMKQGRYVVKTMQKTKKEKPIFNALKIKVRN